MKIAIIGAGFCGLATCWLISKMNPNCQVDLYDPLPIGSGTSGIAAGLLHTFVGPHAKKNWLANETFSETVSLFEEVQKETEICFFQKTLLQRIPGTDAQKDSFFQTAKKYPETEWHENSLWIKQAYIVNSKKYLQALWMLCEKRGVRWIQKGIAQLPIDYDKIIVAAGANATQFPELAELNVKPVKGQILEISWPETVPPPKYPISSSCYLVMHSNNKSCFIGGTYEKYFDSPAPDPETAKRLLLPKALKLFPELQEAKMLSCESGVRAVTPNHRPLICNPQKNLWVITGMGSKGLLYHAYFSKKLLLNAFASEHALPS